MKQQELITQFREHQSLVNAYTLALTTMNFDTYTIAPKDGAPYRNQMFALLYRKAFELMTDTNHIEVVKELATYKGLPDSLQRELELSLRSYEKNKNVPPQLAQEFSKLTNDANDVWEQAKENSNYADFEPYLQDLVKMSKRIYQYRDISGSLYDSYLDDYEPGLTQSSFDTFAKLIETQLVPLVHKINALNLQRPEFLTRKVTVDKQRKLMDILKQYLDFNDSFSYISESVHPFSSTFSINDTRITTAFIEDDWTDSMFSLIHEIGHSTYNHQVDLAYEGTLLADSMSMGMHESQSRLLENNLGRSKAFWTTLFPQLQDILPEVLHDVSLDDFIYGINFSRVSLIRTQADELTYPLHILIRYRLEQKMINTDDLDRLNQLWADEYEHLLGIRPSNDRTGILQDVHWSGGSFGYFPTYALGSAIACQIMHTMRQELEVDHLLETNQFTVIKQWLKEKVHRYGALYDTEKWLVTITNEPFNPQYYIDYLIEKYTKLFNLD